MPFFGGLPKEEDEDVDPFFLLFMGGKGGFDLLGGTGKGDCDDDVDAPFGLLFFRGADPKGSGVEGAEDENGVLLMDLFPALFSFSLISSGSLSSSGSGCFWRVDVAEAKAVAATEPKAPSSGATPGDSDSMMRGDCES